MKPNFVLVSIAALVLTALTGSAQAPDTAQADVYPPVKNASVVFAFSLADDVKGEVIKKALAELSTKEADCGIRYGPMQATSRPSRVFVVVDAPATVSAKDVSAALKKGAKNVEQTAWTCFQSSDPMLGRGLDAGIPGVSPRDFILGISNDLAWVEARGGFSEFFFTPGKIDSAFLMDRFHKLAQPFGVKDVGTVVVETITWPLETSVDAALAKRLEKEIGKISGVKAAKIDVEKKTLEMKVALENQLRGAPPIAMPSLKNALAAAGVGEPETESPPRMRFDTNAIFAVLDKEKVVVAAAPKESAVPGGK